MGVLKFDTPTAAGLYIRNMLFTSFFINMDNLLPILRKIIFPCTVPVCLIFPPRITVAVSFVRPVVNLNFPALGNQF
jgi:hypothetical protein